MNARPTGDAARHAASVLTQGAGARALAAALALAVLWAAVAWALRA